jgi:hypothetical protein
VAWDRDVTQDVFGEHDKLSAILCGPFNVWHDQFSYVEACARQVALIVTADLYGGDFYEVTIQIVGLCVSARLDE